MILSDRDIEHYIEERGLKIWPPLEDDQIQPASVDVRLGNEFVRFKQCRGEIDVRDPRTLEKLQKKETKTLYDGVRIGPGEFLLASTRERIEMPHDLVGRVEGRSSIGRIGLTVHVTAGFIDPGFCGNITLEIANLNRFPITIYTGMRIAQLAFERTYSPARIPYGLGNNKYQGQSGVTASRIGSENHGDQ